MNCPRCLKESEAGGVSCGECGFALSDLDALFGAEKAAMDRITDIADALSKRELRKLEALFEVFDAQFPQLFCAVYLGEMPEQATLSEFACWLLNRAAVSDVDHSRTNEHGIMVVVDIDNHLVNISLGYAVENYVSSWELENILKVVRPCFIGGLYGKGLIAIVKQLRRLLRKKARLAAANPVRFEPPRPMLPVLGEKRTVKLQTPDK